MTVFLVIGLTACNNKNPTTSNNNTNNPIESYDGLLYDVNSDGKTCTIRGLENCKDKNIVIPETINGYKVTSIGDYAFYNCSGLTSITIPDSVTSIGGYAFRDCRSLTSITIPDGVIFIGGGAFNGCSSLESITIPFVGAEPGLTFSDTYQYPFGYIFGTDSYTGGVATKQYYYGSSTSHTTYTTYCIPKSLKKVTINGKYVAVTGGEILCGAFYNCIGLTSITITNDITYSLIMDSAFYNCTSLTSITIPDSVEYISNYAFQNCTSLTRITIPDSVKYIGDYAFQNCTGLTSIIIPDKVTSIGAEAFYGCSGLTSITIPNSVTSIGDSAFQYCWELASVFYEGTEAEWETISIIGVDNAYLLNATRYYYTETEPTESGNYWHYDADGDNVVWKKQ